MFNTLIWIHNTILEFLSFLMKILLKSNGAVIGKNVFIHYSAKILVKELIIGNDVSILENVKIKGNRINIGHNCIISDDAIITGDYNLNLGDKTYVGKKVHLDLSRDLKIGEDVGIGENTVIWTHGFYPPADKGYPITFGEVVIKSNTWISTNIVILPHVTIGENAIVGAGAVVNKSVDGNTIVAGNPAKKIKNVQEILHQKSFIVLMEEIFSDFKVSKINERCMKFEILDHACYIFENYSFDKDLNFEKNCIILFKNCEMYNVIEESKYLWINFNSRIAVKSNSKAFIEVLHIVRNHGIRFIFKY